MTLEHHGIRIEHAIPGRVRLKYHALKGNSELAHKLLKNLSAIEGIIHVDTHPTIGGLVLHYEPEAATSAEFFLKIAATLGLEAADIDMDELEGWLNVLRGNGQSSTASPLADLLETNLAQLSRRDVNVGVLLPAVLCAFGVRSLFFSEQLKAPAWYEFFWFAFGVYYTLNKPESPGSEAT